MILNQRRNPSGYITRRIVRELNLKLEETISKIVLIKRPHGSYIPIDSFPIEFTPELASLVGHAFGDGYVGSTFSYTNLSNSLIIDAKKSIDKLPIRNMTMNKSFNKAHTIRVSSLVKDILIIVGAPRGNKITQQIYIPKWIMNGGNKIKKKFLRSIFDDEGSVSVNKREIVIGFSKIKKYENNLIKFLLNIKTILLDLGVNGITITKGGYRNGKNGITVNYTLRICGSRDFISFGKYVSFMHPDKRIALNQLIKNIDYIKLSKKERDREFIDLLKNNPMLTSLDISKKTKMTHTGAIDKLRDMEKRGLLKRYGKYNSRWDIK